MSVNKVIILGNLCQAPRVRSFENGGKVAQFSVATNKRAFKTKEGREIPERVEYHNIVIAYTKLAEVAEKYLNKGDKVFIEGELRTRQYKDANNVERSITEIYVVEFQMLTPKKKEGQSDAGYATAPPPPELQDDDLPF